MSTLMSLASFKWISWLTSTWRSCIDQITRWIQCFLSTTLSSTLFWSTESHGKLLKREFILSLQSVLCLIPISRNHLRAICWDNSIFPSFTSSCRNQSSTWPRGKTHLTSCWKWTWRVFWNIQLSLKYLIWYTKESILLIQVLLT